MEKKHQKLLKIVLVGGLLFLVSFDSALASPVTEKNVINLVNQERLSAGLNILVENFQLSEAALAKLKDMTQDHYFAHTSPDGASPWFWFDQAGYDYHFAGENLAINFSQAEEQHRSWMASTEHRKNILNPNYQEIGVAVGEGEIEGKKTLMTVQLFGARQDAPRVVGQAIQRPGSGSGNFISRLISPEKIPLFQTASFLIILLTAVSGPLVLAGNYILKSYWELKGIASALTLAK